MDRMFGERLRSHLTMCPHTCALRQAGFRVRYTDQAYARGWGLAYRALSTTHDMIFLRPHALVLCSCGCVCGLLTAVELEEEGVGDL